MNKNISPIKISPFKTIKSNLSPFKKFMPRSPKNEQITNIHSPYKYMNTDANPQIGKNMAQSAHHIGYHNNQIYIAENTNRRQSFLNSIGGRDKINTSSVKAIFLKHDKGIVKKQSQENQPRIRDRKFSHNDLTLSNHTPKANYRKSELRPSIQIQQEEEVVQIRDRKMSYQVGISHFNSQIFKKQTHHTNTSNAICTSPQISRRQSDMLPSLSYMRAKHQNHEPNIKSLVGQFYSPKNSSENGLKNFPSIKQVKLRKNSQNQKNFQSSKDIKLQAPSFLFKKSKKQITEDINKQKPQHLQQQRPVTHNPQIHSQSNLSHIPFIKKQDHSFSKQVQKQRKFCLKDFILIKQLGQGKFGKVLLVKQKTSNFVCAMKVFKKSQIKSDNFVDQFIRQMKIQLYLNHSNIIKMYGYFDDLSYIYILIELACQGSLYKLIQDLQREQRLKNSALLAGYQGDTPIKQSPTGLSLKQTAVMMYQLCSGINYLHSHNIIHRDLKPQNIVIHQKTVKICDFGWSVFKGSQMRTTFCGTPLYLCPQLIVGEQYDQKVDIWAIGIMFYEFLIGPNPFKIHKQQDLANIVLQKIDIDNQSKNILGVKNLDPSVINLINGCLNKNPIQRFDIKDIVNHQFFKKYCPDLSPSLNTHVPRNSTSKMSQAIR